MSEEITITLPKIDDTIITAIDNETITTRETETQAVKALREKYAPLARMNGFIKTSYSYRGDSNYVNETHTFYQRDGSKVRALLCVDAFDKEYFDQNRGRLVGSRLYLTHTREWIEITREGNWSAWQGEPEGWTCGGDADGEVGGAFVILTDDQVSSNYELTDIVSGLAESLKTMAEKLPERLSKVQQRAVLASQLLEALNGSTT